MTRRCTEFAPSPSARASKRTNRAGDDGGTSLEAAVAAVLLTAVLLPLGLFVLSTSLERQSEQTARSLAVAESLVERSIAVPVPVRDSMRVGRVLVRRTAAPDPSGRLLLVDVEAVRAPRRGFGATRDPPARIPVSLLRFRTALVLPPRPAAAALPDDAPPF